MLFITCRLPRGSNFSPRNPYRSRPFVFDLRENAPSNHVFYCDTNGEQHREIQSLPFFHEVATSPHSNILLFIHGFNVMPESALRSAHALQNILDEVPRTQALNDPNGRKNATLVIPIIWPCDDDFGLIKDYWDDQKTADACARPFSRVLNRFQTWIEEQAKRRVTCHKRINVLAHSMGNRVLRETLNAWRHDDLAKGLPMLFRSVFMAAADVHNETLEEEMGRSLIDVSRNVVCYYASDDLALRASKVSNLANGIASRRLGHTGPYDLDRTPRIVTAWDCDDFNLDCDGLGHSYFTYEGNDDHARISPLALHMKQVIETGRVTGDATGHPRRGRLQWPGG